MLRGCVRRNSAAKNYGKQTLDSDARPRHTLPHLNTVLYHGWPPRPRRARIGQTAIMQDFDPRWAFVAFDREFAGRSLGQAPPRICTEFLNSD